MSASRRRFRLAGPSLLAAALAGALAGCSSGGGTDALRATPSAAPGTAAVSAASASSAAASAASRSAGRAPVEAGVPSGSAAPIVTATARARGTTLFAAPSGNISCALSGTTVRCDIRDRTWTPPPKPADCPLDWGPALGLDSSGARFLCVGDAVGPVHRVLGYGHALRAGPMVCTSRRAGVRCVDADTRHGFSLARGAYSLF